LLGPRAAVLRTELLNLSPGGTNPTSDRVPIGSNTGGLHRHAVLHRRRMKEKDEGALLPPPSAFKEKRGSTATDAPRRAGPRVNARVHHSSMKGGSMQRTQHKLFEALDRVDEFLEQNREVLGTVVPASAQENFRASRTQLVEHMKAQDSFQRATHTTVAAKRVLREELIRNHMIPLAVVSRTRLAGSNDANAFRLLSRSRPFAAFVVAGYGMADAATLNESALLAGGLPSGFIDRLIGATDALRDAVNAKSETNARQVEATAGLRKAARIGRDAIRVLNALVRSALKDENTLLDRWTNISRVAAAATPAAVASPESDKRVVTSGTSTPPVQGPSQPEQDREAVAA